MMRFILWRSLTLRGFRWRWRLKAGNGEIIAHGESYSRKFDAERAIDLVKGSANSATDEVR